MEFKSFFLILKFLLNLFFPLLFYSTAKKIVEDVDKILIIYVVTLLIPLIGIIYTLTKQSINNRRFLHKPYVPGFYLMAFIATFDIIASCIMYYYLLEYANINNLQVGWVILKIIGHFVASLTIFILILQKKEREKKVISSTRHKILGIISRDLDGLMQGQPVEIIQSTEGGYIIKDNNDQNFVVKGEDLMSVI